MHELALIHWQKGKILKRTQLFSYLHSVAIMLLFGRRSLAVTSRRRNQASVFVSPLQLQPIKNVCLLDFIILVLRWRTAFNVQYIWMFGGSSLANSDIRLRDQVSLLVNPFQLEYLEINIYFNSQSCFYDEEICLIYDISGYLLPFSLLN